MLDLKGKYKWDAWQQKKGMCYQLFLISSLGLSKDDAKKQYVAKYVELEKKYGVN